VTSFLWVGMDQLISQAAKMRYMFGGQAELPVTFRIRMFYARGAAAHHSDRNYPIFMNTPGLKIICPTNAYDAKGLMKTAVRDNDVCMLFEDGIAISSRTEVPDNEDLPGGELLVPFGVANTVRAGSDVTVVGIAGGVQHALDAAKTLETEGISLEVIDPRTLVPLDMETILKSVERTGRLVVVDPAEPFDVIHDDRTEEAILLLGVCDHRLKRFARGGSSAADRVIRIPAKDVQAVFLSVLLDRRALIVERLFLLVS